MFLLECSFQSLDTILIWLSILEVYIFFLILHKLWHVKLNYIIYFTYYRYIRRILPKYLHTIFSDLSKVCVVFIYSGCMELLIYKHNYFLLVFFNLNNRRNHIKERLVFGNRGTQKLSKSTLPDWVAWKIPRIKHSSCFCFFCFFHLQFLIKVQIII